MWRGTAFDCPSIDNEILFLHGSSDVEKICGDGTIVGRLIRVENNTYISQLTVSVQAQVVGTNISCFHDRKGILSLIGSTLLTLTTSITI